VEAYDPKAELRQQHKRSDQQSYAQYEKDRRSAYFGNLPLNMTADVLKTLASQCGNVLYAEVATKEVPQTGGRSRFHGLVCMFRFTHTWLIFPFSSYDVLWLRRVCAS
jgi:hypothetical protein